MQVKDVYGWRSRLAWLQPQLLAHQLQLIVLELLERLLPRRVADDTRRVDHARAEEPIVKVVTAVVVVADLVLVLVLRVHDDLGEEVAEDVAEELVGELEGRELLPVLERLQDVAYSKGEYGAKMIAYSTHP